MLLSCCYRDYDFHFFFVVGAGLCIDVGMGSCMFNAVHIDADPMMFTIAIVLIMIVLCLMTFSLPV